MGTLALLLFLSIFLLLMYGYPVAFTLGGLSLLYGLCFLPMEVMALLPIRIAGIMAKEELIAVPLFVFMGIMLEKSGLAARLLETMALLFRQLPGGLAIAVIIVGALLAASTGIVGATVITMGLISLPTMLQRGYRPSLAAGVIAASGTLGQIIPPSIVLILLGSVLNVSVGKLFTAALMPGLMLVLVYMLYVFVLARIRPADAPPIPEAELAAFRAEGYWLRLFRAFFLPFLLISAVLGSILAGIASPTEAAAVGAMGAMLLTWTEGKGTKAVLQSVMQETTHLTTMVFLILLGATTFTLVFRELGGDHYLVSLIDGAAFSKYEFLAVVMVAIFVAGFFIDFIEIIFIIVPVVAPVFQTLGVDPVWLGLLIALNLQTSFLTPPFGFALFYLKGVAPPEVTTQHLYKGVIPFIGLQLLVLLAVALFPGWFVG